MRRTHVGPSVFEPRDIDVGQLDVQRLEDGIVVEDWQLGDDLTMAVQLGIVPDPTKAPPQKDGDEAASAEKKSANEPANATRLPASGRNSARA